MTRRKWFRAYHGITADMTLAVCAQAAGITRGDMIALWFSLCECANRAETPGSIAGFAVDEAALQLNLTSAHINTALGELRTRKKIDSHQRIYGQDRLQPSSTTRVRALRARRKPQTPPAPVKQNIAVDHDSPAAIAARRARLQQNNSLIIGEPKRR